MELLDLEMSPRLELYLEPQCRKDKLQAIKLAKKNSQCIIRDYWSIQYLRTKEQYVQANNDLDALFVKIKPFQCAVLWNLKGKIERALAGTNPYQLNESYLKKSWMAYNCALQIAPSSWVLWHSLGFLLQDYYTFKNTNHNNQSMMAEEMLKQSYQCHLKATFLLACKDTYHGLASCMSLMIAKFKDTRAHSRPYKILYDRINYFFQLGDTGTSKVMLDIGLFCLANGNTSSAMFTFTTGLFRNPSHAILRYERGKYLLPKSVSNGWSDFGEICKSNRGQVDWKHSLCDVLLTSSSSTNQTLSRNFLIEQEFISLLKQASISLNGLNGLNAAAADSNISCRKVFISYAWGTKHNDQVTQLATYLQHAGCQVYYDKWCIQKGEPVMNFVNILQDMEVYALVVGTPLYKAKAIYAKPKSSDERFPYVAIEWNLIKKRFAYAYPRAISDSTASRTTGQCRSLAVSGCARVVPVIFEGTTLESFPRELILAQVNIVDFRDQTQRYQQLWDLVTTIYNVDHTKSTILWNEFIRRITFPSNDNWDLFTRVFPATKTPKQLKITL